jgi:hypothetical protein
MKLNSETENTQAAHTAGEHSNTKARADWRPFRKAGACVGVAQPPKIDRPTSRAMLVQHNDWTPHDKATYLITALNKLDAHILHGVCPLLERCT